MIRNWMKMAAAIAAVAVCLGAAEKPPSVIHVVTVKWKQGTTEEQIKKAVGGVEAAAKLFPGMTRIWLRPLNVQGQPIGKCDPEATGATHAFVMEFENEAALKSYANSPAQKAFYAVYLEHREESRTHDITN
jgi:hypothetical protein